MNIVSAPHRLLLPPLSERLADGQPVMTREQALHLNQKVLKLTSADIASVHITHAVKSVLQLATGRVQHTNDGDQLQIWLNANYGENKGTIYLETNQLDEAALRELVARAEALGKEMIGLDEQVGVRQWDEQDTYPE